jgi:phage shock protein PspC (stress-responsive transcriptional regulator)
VAGGLGRYLDVDPLVIRVVLVVLAVFGGSGLLLYGLFWLLVPAEGEPESEGQALLGGRGRAVALVAILLSLVGLVGFGRSFRGDFGFGAVSALIVVGVAVYLLRRSDRPAAVEQPAAQGPAPAASGTWGQSEGVAYTGSPAGAAAPYAGPPAYAPPPDAPPPYGPSPGYPPAPRPARPRPRAFLGPVTFFAVLLTGGVLVGWNVATDSDLTAAAVLASCLAVTGAGLLVGAFAGRARGLIALGLVLSLLTTVAAAFSGTSVRGGIGERTWDPRTVAEVESPYRLGVGEAELDLSGLVLPAGRDLRVVVRQGLGELRVVLPDDVTARVDAQVDVGNLRTPDRDDDGADLTESYEQEGAGTGTLVVDAELGVGELEVRRASS